MFSFIQKNNINGESMPTGLYSSQRPRYRRKQFYLLKNQFFKFWGITEIKLDVFFSRVYEIFEGVNKRNKGWAWGEHKGGHFIFF